MSAGPAPAGSRVGGGAGRAAVTPAGRGQDGAVSGGRAGQPGQPAAAAPGPEPAQRAVRPGSAGRTGGDAEGARAMELRRSPRTAAGPGGAAPAVCAGLAPGPARGRGSGGASPGCAQSPPDARPARAQPLCVRAAGAAPPENRVSLPRSAGQEVGRLPLGVLRGAPRRVAVVAAEAAQRGVLFFFLIGTELQNKIRSQL